MLEITQEVLARIDPLLDAGDTSSAVKLLKVLDEISLQAIVIHVLHERGASVAQAIVTSYLSATEARGRRSESPAVAHQPTTHAAAA